jgi:predicted MPP superfamily phosphohydrolase
MARVSSFVIFFSVAMGLLGLAHYYLWLRLVRDPSWPQPARSLATALVVLLALCLPLGMVLTRLFARTLQPLAWITFVWMGLVFLLVVTLGTGDLARGFASLATRLLGTARAASAALPADPDRRLLVQRAWAGMALLVAGGAGSLGMRAALGVPDVKRLRLELRRLPASLGGLRLVQISDLHIGNLLARPWLEQVVAKVNALSPDLVAITGDLVDGSVDDLRLAVAPLATLRARYGVFFVTGNHEYYSGVDEWIEELGRLGVRVLRNERVTIGAGDASFELAGIDDASAHRFGGGHGADLGRALEGYDRSRELVLMAHQPRGFDHAAAAGVGLQLSGHTHGGQMWPFTYLVRLNQPYVAGLDRLGDAQIYVSCGTGFWGPPMRLAAPSEITCLELHPAAAAVASERQPS